MRLGEAAPRRRADAEDDVREFCAGKIAHYKVPRYVRFTDEFPMTVTGKVQKFKMRETSVTSSAWRRPAATRPPDRGPGSDMSEWRGRLGRLRGGQTACSETSGEPALGTITGVEPDPRHHQQPVYLVDVSLDGRGGLRARLAPTAR